MQIATIIANRRARRQSNLSPSDSPVNADAAYEMAKGVTAAQGGQIGAWKLGATTRSTRSAFGTSTVYFGPLLDEEVYLQPRSITIGLAPFRGEAEIALRVGRDVLPGEIGQLTEDLFDVFAPALECPWSVVANLPEAGLGALLMDRCAAGLLALSRPVKFDPVAANGRLDIVVGGRVLASGTAEDNLVMTPAAAALSAIEQIYKAGMDVTAGQWISTGGITACVDLPSTGTIELHYDGRPALCFEVEGPA